MKSKCKKLFIYLFAVFMIMFVNANYIHAASEEGIEQVSSTDNNQSRGLENFNFIKSDEDYQGFIYDGSICLYLGIVLIAISICGIIITFIPRRKRKVKKRRQSQKYAKK